MNGPDFQYDGLSAFAPITNVATSTKKGLMSAADKAKLDSLGSGGGAWTRIGNVVTLTGSQASVTFSSIPNTYLAVRLFAHVRGDSASVAEVLYLRCNGDTGANYDWEKLNPTANTSPAQETFADTGMRVGAVPAAGGAASQFGNFTIDLLGYAGNAEKAVAAYGAWKYGTTSASVRSEWDAGFWRSIAAITSLTLYAGAGNLVADSWFALYGLS